MRNPADTLSNYNALRCNKSCSVVIHPYYNTKNSAVMRFNTPEIVLMRLNTPKCFWLFRASTFTSDTNVHPCICWTHAPNFGVQHSLLPHCAHASILTPTHGRKRCVLFSWHLPLYSPRVGQTRTTCTLILSETFHGVRRFVWLLQPKCSHCHLLRFPV